jgi:hypothetical protein
MLTSVELFNSITGIRQKLPEQANSRQGTPQPANPFLCPKLTQWQIAQSIYRVLKDFDQ